MGIGLTFFPFLDEGVDFWSLGLTKRPLIICFTVDVGGLYTKSKSAELISPLNTFPSFLLSMK